MIDPMKITFLLLGLHRSDPFADVRGTTERQDAAQRLAAHIEGLGQATWAQGLDVSGVNDC